MKKIYILGGEFSELNQDQNLVVKDYGGTAIELEKIFNQQLKEIGLDKEYETILILTKLTKPNNNFYNIVTKDDAEVLLNKIIADPDTRVIVQNFTLCDFDAKIRKERKDIFAIGFKTTAGENDNVQYLRGLELLKKNSLNLVLANDIKNYRNMIIAPEETRYCEQVGNDISKVLQYLVKMTLSRMQNHFTRSTVVEGKAINWNSEEIPENLREVVNYCIEKGAYKTFLGKTAGHFAVKLNDEEVLTSIRKSNFNQLEQVGLVKIESKNDNEVIAHGFRPSVGGQSQRIIFKENPDLDCIVHFHCPVKEEFKDTIIPVRSQWQNECGSHECGKNTSNGLREINLGNGNSLKVVYLDEHGPNLVFNKSIPANLVTEFIDKHFDLSKKTGGLVELTT